MLSIYEAQRAVVDSLMGIGDSNKAHELGRTIGELEDALDAAERVPKLASDVLTIRLRLAMAALDLLQLQLPGLRDAGKRVLALAGEEAIRTACSPSTVHGDRSSAPHKRESPYNLPPEFAAR